MSEDRIDMVPMVQQRLMWDILPCEQVQNYWDVMKLVPPSPDTAEMAHAESHDRMQKVAPLQPLCEMYIVLTADIITEVMYKQLLTRLDPEDDHIMEMAQECHDTMVLQNREVVRGALYSTLAHMIDGGFLTVNATPRMVTR